MNGVDPAVVVALTPFEFEMAAYCAALRQLRALRNGRAHRFGARDEEGMRMHVIGTVGELATAKYLGRYWDGIAECGDVRDVEVRTRSSHAYELILHPDDRDLCPYVLVTWANGSIVLRGWILGRAGKRPEFWQDPAGGRPAFFVPQASLRAMEDLRPYLDFCERSERL